MSTINFTDPLFASQWYLVNTGQRGGPSRLDINVLPAWQAGFNGAGIVVAINDDGLDLTHPDLIANIDATKVYDTNRNTTGEGFSGTSNAHGTVVGSIVGMSANGIGGVGVAYKATLVPGLAVGASVAFATANLFKSNIAANVDVSVNSWGADPAFAENFGASGSEEDRAWGAELLRAATVGRNGLGMVIEVSAGNERGNRADAALSNFTGNKVTIAVGSVDENGVATDYSTPAASLLITAFGGVGSAEQSENKGFGAVSADIQGSAGYNKTPGAEGDYAYQNQGTSYSGPMVGAAAALMLQANPLLGFRDVSAILAMTARQTDATNTSWIVNGSKTWNVGGMHFSRDYGYGLLDVGAAVRLAQGWVGEAATAANWVSAASGPATTQTQPIPDDAAQFLTVTAQVADAIRIDRMEFDLNLTALAPSQLKAEITSPSGTTITLFDRPLTRSLKDGAPDTSISETPWPETFTIGSTAFLGESSQGTWTLKLTDLVTGAQATFNSLTVRAWGSAASANDQYVLTNEFKGSKTLTDSGGTDTLNAAAMDRAVTLNLAGVSQLGTDSSVTLAQGTVIENAVGGLGADLLQGNDVANLLRGMAGNDTLVGGAGDDTLEGGVGDDRLDGGAGIDRLTGSTGDDTYLVDAQGDLCFENAGEGTDSVLCSASFYLYANVENLTLTGSAFFGVGNALDNALTGNEVENLLIAGAGNDVVRGGGARDAIFGETGADQLHGDAGIDYVVAGTGNDTIYGGADADEVYGQEGDDLIYGGDDFATDILVGGEGNDTIDGGPAWDQMYGGAGNDTYYVSQQVDWVFEQPGEGTDTVIADSPNGYYLFANIENLTLVGNTPFGVGNELANLILGNAIGNTLLGGAGNDTLDGGAGLDILWGQEGADTFRISKGTSTDIIADFQLGTDKLDVSAFGFTTLAQLKARMAQVNSDVSLNLDNGDQVILLGVNLAALGSGDVVLGPGGG